MEKETTGKEMELRKFKLITILSSHYTGFALPSVTTLLTSDGDSCLMLPCQRLTASHPASTLPKQGGEPRVV